MKFLTSIDLNKNELQNTVIQNLAVAPENPAIGQIYYHTTEKLLYQYDGSTWKAVGAPITSIDWNIIKNTPNTIAGYGIIDAKIEGQKITLGNKVVEVPTSNSQLDNDSGFITAGEAPVQSINSKVGSVVLTSEDVGALSINGGALMGDLNLSGNTVTGLRPGSAETDAVTKKQLSDAISGLGAVLNFKGVKETSAELPSEAENKVGDVWYVKEKSSEYVWVDNAGVKSWEPLGSTIDLSGYLAKADLASSTGSDTKNAMSQAAVTEALGLKANKAETDQIPFVKITTGILTTSLNQVTVEYKGTLVGTFVKDINGEKVMLDEKIDSNKVTFTAFSHPVEDLICTVVYF